MDSYREHPSEYDAPAAETPPPSDTTMVIGTDERRMHVRAYNYWVSLLDGRDYPSIEDLEPADVADFAANSVLLDFTCGRDNPATPYIGAAIREECELNDGIKSIAEVPSRSLLSRLTDHYMQIIANRAPVGFEAEFENQRGESICYRGILMPFSSDGDTIDFIYGVINWKRGAEPAVAQSIVPQLDPVANEPEPAVEPEIYLEAEAAAQPEISVEAGIALEPEFDTSELEQEMPLQLDDAVEAGEPEEEEVLELDDMVEALEPEEEEDNGAAFGSLVGLVGNSRKEPVAMEPPESDGPPEPPAHAFGQPFAREVDFSPLPIVAAETEDEELDLPELGEDAGLADRLWAARETAEAVKSADGRSRAALYQALSLAYDFAIAAQANPQDYEELLEESGMKSQARAPMTPIVKLVFGIDYDKTRLTEFASALSYAQRQEIALGGFQGFIEKQAGGLKALVAAERQAKRPEAKPDTKLEAAREMLRAAPPLDLQAMAGDEEFGLVVTRRNADGVHEVVAVIDDPAMVERAIRRAV